MKSITRLCLLLKNINKIKNNYWSTKTKTPALFIFLGLSIFPLRRTSW